MFDQLKADVARIRAVDPAARSNLEIFLLYSGLHALRSHRRANWLYRHNLPFFARAVSQLSKFTTGIEIHPAAQIGRGVFIDHGSGVVIGETAVVGDDCVIYQGATLGGTGKETGKRHPTLGNNVLVGAGAKVLGSFKIGDNCRIAAGSVVLQEVPANCTVVGIPGRIVKMFHKGTALDGCSALDQIHFPDPVRTDIECLNRGQTALANRLIEIENELREEKAERRKLAAQRDCLQKELLECQEELRELRAKS